MSIILVIVDAVCVCVVSSAIIILDYFVLSIIL